MLTYIAKLHPLPGSARALERVLVSKILRVPGHSFGSRKLLNLTHANGPSFTSVVALSAAAAGRTVTKTITSWPSLLAQLVATAAEVLPAKVIIQGALSQPFWDEAPIVFFLHSACSLASALPLSSPFSSDSLPLTPFPHVSIPCPPLPLPTLSLPFSAPRIHEPVGQGDAYKVLLKQWYPNSWVPFFRRRLVGPFQLDASIVSQIDFHRILIVLDKDDRKCLGDFVPLALRQCQGMSFLSCTWPG